MLAPSVNHYLKQKEAPYTELVPSQVKSTTYLAHWKEHGNGLNLVRLQKMPFGEESHRWKQEIFEKNTDI